MTKSKPTSKPRPAREDLPTGYADQPGSRPSYRVSSDPEAVARESERLGLLGDLRDRASARTFEELGIDAGWNCLDIGCGGGSLAQWLARRVGPSGSVLATDVDTRFQDAKATNLEVRQHDIVREDLPDDSFDLVHARAVLQTVEQREAVLDKMVRTARPGGWVVVEDPEWSSFERQPLPEAFRSLYEAMMVIAETNNGYDRYWGARLLSAFRHRGLENLRIRGEIGTMRGDDSSSEWLILAYERAAPSLIAAGLLEESTADAGLRAARDPGFLVMAPTSVVCCGRKP